MLEKVRREGREDVKKLRFVIFMYQLPTRHVNVIYNDHVLINLNIRSQNAKRYELD